MPSLNALVFRATPRATPHRIQEVGSGKDLYDSHFMFVNFYWFVRFSPVKISCSWFRLFAVMHTVTLRVNMRRARAI